MSNQVEVLVNIQNENRNRATVFWRGILVAPAYLFLIAFTHQSYLIYTNHSTNSSHLFDIGTGFIVVGPVVLGLLFRQKYPSYVLSFNHALAELTLRVGAYLLLLTDEYPSIERNPNIAVLFPDVEGGAKLSRWLPLVKWFLAIPLYLVGAFYSLIAVLLTIYAWLVTSISGKYPKGVSTWVFGSIRFWMRVQGYVVYLVTDEYPPFSLGI